MASYGIINKPLPHVNITSYADWPVLGPTFGFPPNGGDFYLFCCEVATLALRAASHHVLLGGLTMCGLN